ncbi:MAG: phosphodiester glycosidase family protein, partial [Synergistaceae bacterium]|nr:phosphodiester glycosidase family protein [Synergistaceae bacterium]
MRRTGSSGVVVLCRVFVCLLTLLILILAALYGALGIVSRGPSPAARDLFVVSMLETSALKFVPSIFFDDAEIAAIVLANKIEAPEETADMDMIHIDAPDFQNEPEEKMAIVVDDVKGDRYRGKMMIVADPGRLLVGTGHDEFVEGVRGRTVEKIIERYGGIAGVNAGGFFDPDGKGDGSKPIGLVISQGRMRWGSASSRYSVIGFDAENRLVVGQMTGREALARGVRDAVSFGPVLMLNGVPMGVKGFGGGLNPRTAIGQRADGAVLLLVLDGRQMNSLGATLGDIIDVMARYGAVNAANLDGGSSTVMYYGGELINSCCSLYGP